MYLSSKTSTFFFLQFYHIYHTIHLLLGVQCSDFSRFGFLFLVRRIHSSVKLYYRCGWEQPSQRTFPSPQRNSCRSPLLLQKLVLSPHHCNRERKAAFQPGGSGEKPHELNRSWKWVQVQTPQGKGCRLFSQVRMGVEYGFLPIVSPGNGVSHGPPAMPSFKWRGSDTAVFVIFTPRIERYDWKCPLYLATLLLVLCFFLGSIFRWHWAAWGGYFSNTLGICSGDKINK